MLKGGEEDHALLGAPMTASARKWKRCRWIFSDDGYWVTDCANAFVVNEGTPTENKMKFCCYCGRNLKEVPCPTK